MSLRRAYGSVHRVFEDGLATRPHRLGDHRLEPGDDTERVAFLDEALELEQGLLEPGGVDLRTGGAHDLRMRGGADRLAVVPEHLVNLFAGPRPGEHDRDVLLAPAG